MRKATLILVSAALSAGIALSMTGCGGQNEAPTEASTAEESTSSQQAFLFTETQTQQQITELETATPSQPAASTIPLTAPAVPQTIPAQPSVTTIPTTTAPTTAPTAAPTTAPTTASTTVSTTAPTTASTTVEPKGSGSLKKAVLDPLGGSVYTESMGFTADKSDKITKAVSGRNRAYVVSMPSDNFTIRFIRYNSEYFAVSNGMYCKLTKEQYDKEVALFDKTFSFDFSSLSFVESKTELYSGSLYTKETYKAKDGSTAYLWFKNGSLKFVEPSATAQKIEMSVSGSADENLFIIPDSVQESTYEDMTSLIYLAEMCLQ